MISLRYFGYVLLALAIAACSGGSGDSAKTYSTSKFIDSAVEGLYYSGLPSGTVGTTAADGAFTYVAGDTVNFKIGGSDGLDIGSSSPVNGVPVVVTDLPGGEQVAQILQTFSESANPGEKLNLSRVKFSANDVKTLRAHIVEKGDLDAFKANPEIAKITASVGEQLGKLLTIKSRADVESHLATSLAGITTAPRLNDQLYIVIKEYGDGLLNPVAFLGFSSADKSFKLFDNSFHKISGSFVQGADNLDLSIVNFQDLNAQGDGYTDRSSTFAGCKFSLIGMTNWTSKDPENPAPQGFKANSNGRNSCSDSSKNDTSNKDPLLAAALDTSFKLADLSGKTLTTNLPKNNGTKCKQKVKFVFTPKTADTLNVYAYVDPAEDQFCKDSFHPDKVKLTFGKARPPGGNYIDGVFALDMRYSDVNRDAKVAIMYVARPKILANPTSAKNPTANAFAVLAYADNNTDDHRMQMKWANGGPVELKATVEPTLTPTAGNKLYFLTKRPQDDVIPDAFIKFSSNKSFEGFDTKFAPLAGTFNQNAGNVDFALTGSLNNLSNCSFSVAGLTSSLEIATGPWGLKGFLGTPQPAVCGGTVQTGGTNPILGIEIDTITDTLDSFAGKTLVTKVPGDNGTGCNKLVSFRFTAKDADSLNVIAILQTGESTACEDAFATANGTLTFEKAKLDGSTIVPGVFTFKIAYSNPVGKNVSLLLMRPKYTTVPTNEFSVNGVTLVPNRVALVVYADDVDGTMTMKSTSGGPAKLFDTPPP